MYKKDGYIRIHNKKIGGNNIMKKSTLLSLATAGAIVATSAFTFASWDQLDDSKTVNLSYADPVVVTVADLTQLGDLGDTINGKSSVDITVPVTVTGSKNGDKLKFEATTTDNQKLDNSGLTVAFYDETGNTLIDSTGVAAPTTKTNYIARVSVATTSTYTEKPANLPTDIQIKATLDRPDSN